MVGVAVAHSAGVSHGLISGSGVFLFQVFLYFCVVLWLIQGELWPLQMVISGGGSPAVATECMKNT